MDSKIFKSDKNKLIGVCVNFPQKSSQISELNTKYTQALVDALIITFGDNWASDILNKLVFNVEKDGESKI